MSITADAYFARRLSEHVGRGFVFAGVTDSAERRERIRKAIIDHRLSDVIIGSVNGKPQTYRQAFERAYGALEGSRESENYEA